MEAGGSLAGGVHCLWAEVACLIEVGTMAGAGKAAGVAGPAQVGSVAVDEGAFRESLTASVGGLVVAHGERVTNMPAAMLASKPVGASAMSGAVMPGARALAAAAVPTAATPVGGTVVAPTKSALEVPKAEGSADQVGIQELEAAVPAQAGASTHQGSLPVVKDAEGGKPVVAGEQAAPFAGGKALKVEAGSAGKKAVGKSLEAEAGAVGRAEPMSAAGVMGGSVPPVAVQVIAFAAAPVAGTIAEVQAQAPAAGSSDVAKVVGGIGAVKGSGREAKKLDDGVPVSPKVGAGVAVAVASPAAGMGNGHAVPKEGTTAAVQGVGGTAAAVAPVGMVASHTGVTGIAGAKVAGNLEGVSTAAAGQGAAAGQEVKTLAATPNLLEVGIDSGTHGWLRVRAELGQTGEVTASMVAGSAGQADTLRRELPAMSTYLAGESVGVSSLAVNAAGAAAGTQDAAMTLGAGAQGGGGDGRAQGSGVNSQSGGQANSAGGSEGGVSGLEFSGEELPAAVYANGSGSWLSVRV